MTLEEFKQSLFDFQRYTWTNAMNTTSGVMGVSVDSLFIPVFAGVYSKLNVHQNRRVLLYTFFESDISYRVSRRSSYRANINHGEIITRRSYGNFTVGGKKYSFTKGCLYDGYENKILLCLSVKRDKFWTFHNNFDPSNMVLVVSHDFFYDARYKALRNKFKVYFEELHRFGVDTLIATSVEKWCFGINLPPPEFVSAVDRMRYFSDIHNFLPLRNDEATKKKVDPSAVRDGDTVTITSSDGTTRAFNIAEF